MSKLTDFFNKNKISEIKKEVILERLPEPFIVKALGQKRFDAIQKKCTGKAGKDGVSFDGGQFNVLSILEGCQYPDFSSAEFVSEVEATDPIDAINKCLLPGEIADLSSAISEISGFTQTLKKDVEEAKN